MANQIECPVCGVMIEVDDNSGLKIECPNCHEMVTNNYARKNLENKREATRKQLNSSETKSWESQHSSNDMNLEDNDYKNFSTGNDGLAIDAVSESKYDEDGIKKELVNALVEKDFVPSDIFEKINIEMVRKYYLPYQLFEGIYQVPWNTACQWNENYVENGEKKTIRQNRNGESNGIAEGQFSYLCLVCSEDDIPPKIFEKAQKKSSVLEKVVPYSSDIEDNCNNIVVMPNSNFETNWTNKVSKEVFAKIKEDAEKQAHSNETSANVNATGTGDSLKNFNIKKLQTILIPFWYIDYTYQDTHYWFILDERGESQELEAPQNAEEMAIIEENEKKKTGCVTAGIVLLLFALSVILGWIYGSWLVFFGLAAISVMVFCWSINKEIKVDDLNKEVKNENKKRRQELAQGLLSRWFVDKESQLRINKKDDIIETKVLENDDYIDSII